MGYIIPVNLHWYQPKNIIFQLAGVNRYSPKKANINGYTANEKTKCNEILFFLKNIPTPNSKNDYCVFSPSIYSHNCPSYIVATITPQITYNNLSYCVFQLCTGIFPFTFLIVGARSPILVDRQQWFNSPNQIVIAHNIVSTEYFFI